MLIGSSADYDQMLKQKRKKAEVRKLLGLESTTDKLTTNTQSSKIQINYSKQIPAANCHYISSYW